MKKITLLLLPGVLALATFPGCNSGENTQKGAAGGAVAGALIGGIIGHQSGETGAGAALGAAAGGVAGGAYGKSKDNAVASSQGRDSYGYTSGDYLSLLTPGERDQLERRASGSNGSLADFLSSEEKSNLRKRAKNQNVIGR